MNADVINTMITNQLKEIVSLTHVLTNDERKKLVSMIGSVTAAQLQDLLSLNSPANPGQGLQPYAVGQPYLIRTVTHIDTGLVQAVGDHEIVLTKAAWIADTGRYHDAFKDGTLEEVEPYPQDEPVIVGRGAVIDACRWTHPLPTVQK